MYEPTTNRKKHTFLTAAKCFDIELLKLYKRKVNKTFAEFTIEVFALYKEEEESFSYTFQFLKPYDVKREMKND